MNETVDCKSVKQTMAAAKKFAKTLKPGDLIALSGDLGSGKTTFVKGLAAGLGFKNVDEVTSPTFTLMNIYGSKPVLYHFDLYRLEKPEELATIGFEEFTNDPKAISCVEWAERAKDLMPPHAHWIHFEVVREKTRRLVFGAHHGK